MKTYRFLLIWISMIIFLIPVLADQKQYLFEQGNKYFEEEDYSGAIQAYQEIITMGFENPELYYNLGNSYYKNGQFAHAILNYERALRLRPHDEDIKFNLEIARLTQVDEIPELPEMFYTRFLKDFHSRFSVRTLTILTLLFYLLLIGCITGWLVSLSKKIRIIMKGSALILGLLLLIFGTVFVSKIHTLNNSIEGIIMSPEVYVRSSPTESGTDIFTIHTGLKVKISNQNADWHEIRLPDGKEGWIESKHLEII